MKNSNWDTLTWTMFILHTNITIRRYYILQNIDFCLSQYQNMISNILTILYLIYNSYLLIRNISPAQFYRATCCQHLENY